MENISLGIYTESYVISRGIQYILSKNSGLTINIIPFSEINIKQYISDNNISLLIISDEVFHTPHIKTLYKTAKDLSYGIIRTTNKALNPLFEFKIDIDIYDSEEEINKRINHYLETNSYKNRLSIEDSELSKREIEILRMVALGHTNQIIADLLFISKHTVVTHRKKITAKLGIKTISGLTVYALLNNIIETNEMEGLY